MREYEIGIVFRPDLSSDRFDSEVTKLETIMCSNEGQILYKDHWGPRKLAYPIHNYHKGNYIFYNVANEGAFVSELERIMRITDGVLRYLTIKLSDSINIEERIVQLNNKVAEEEQKRLAEENRE